MAVLSDSILIHEIKIWKIDQINDRVVAIAKGSVAGVVKIVTFFIGTNFQSLRYTTSMLKRS